MRALAIFTHGRFNGSLGGIIALIFFYLTRIVFLLGGQFNAALWCHHNGAFDIE